MSYKRKLDDGCTSDTVVPGPELKRQHDTEPGGSQSSVEFDGMCDDVIDKIMCYLRLRDLANISDTNSRLRAIARSVFSRRYAHGLISLDAFYHHSSYLAERSDKGMDILPEQQTAMYYKQDVLFRIYHAIICFKIARNFGDSIKHIRLICFDPRWPRIPDGLPHLIDNISEFCGNSLETLDLNGYPTFTLNKPLIKLQEFTYGPDSLENTEALKSMPSLRALHLTQFPKIMADNYEKLERVRVELKTEDQVQSFIPFTRQNKQIKYLSLRVGSECAPEQSQLAYSTIADNLTELKTLKLEGTPKSLPMTRYHFKTVESFSIYNVDAQHVFEFDNLRKVALKSYNSMKFLVKDFVQRNKKLKILKLAYLYSALGDESYVRSLLNELPELEEIMVDCEKDIGDALCSILRSIFGKEWEQYEKEKNGKPPMLFAPKYQRFRKIKSKTSA